MVLGFESSRAHSWVRTGDRLRAIRHYDRLVDLLRDELDMEPEPETNQLGASLRSATLP